MNTMFESQDNYLDELLNVFTPWRVPLISSKYFMHFQRICNPMQKYGDLIIKFHAKYGDYSTSEMFGE